VSQKPSDGYDMNRPLDEELLAEFIDGRLGSKDRERVVAWLAEDEDAYEVFLTASEVASTAPVSDVKRTGRRWIRYSAPLAAAAALVLMVRLGGFLGDGGSTPSEISDPFAVFSVVQATDESVVRSRIDNPTGWGVVRGSQRNVDLEGTSFRIGVLSVQWQISLAIRDSLSALYFAEEMNDLLTTVETAQPLLVSFAGVRRGAAAEGLSENVLSEVQSFVDSAKAILDGERLSLGRWVEVANLELASGRTEFFIEKESRAALGLLEILLAGGPVDEMPALVPIDPAEWIEYLKEVSTYLGA